MFFYFFAISDRRPEIPFLAGGQGDKWPYVWPDLLQRCRTPKPPKVLREVRVLEDISAPKKKKISLGDWFITTTGADASGAQYR